MHFLMVEIVVGIPILLEIYITQVIAAYRAAKVNLL